MTELTTTDYASQVVDKVNANFGSEVITGDDSAADVVAALNTAFAGTSGAVTLTENDSATDFVEGVNTNFGLYDDGDVPSGPLVKFLHLSDPHGYDTPLIAAKSVLGDDAEISHVFITGDMTKYSYNAGFLPDFTNAMTALGDKLLMLAGNHDSYDNNWGNDSNYGYNGVSQTHTTEFLKSKLGNRVTWGDQNNVASYWHKDIQISETSKLRIIALDQYEIDAVRNPGRYTYFTMYSQAQINWLIARLEELSASDYIIIALHESPVQSPSMPDSYAVGLVDANNPRKLFVSENLKEFGNRMDNGVAREPQLSLLPRILKAYIHKETLTMTYNNYGGGSTPDITINKTFSGTPATFLFWLCGHMHCDIVDYIPNESALNYGGESGDNWSDQLLMDITAADTRVNWASEDDLGGYVNDNPPANPPQNDYTYRLNKVTLDFGKKTIRLDRIGACNTAGGRVRNTITFPFKKN